MIEEKLDVLIYEVGNKKVILVRDLAKLYGYKNGTKDLNKLIKRNIDKFSRENYFQLTNEEYDNLWFQCGTAKEEFNMSRTLPYVLTKEGILILSKLIKKENIVLINSQLMKEFDKDNFTQNELSNYQILPETHGKIENLIYEVRGVQVMLDRDLALLYGCINGTKDINKSVKRNIERFPNDFYFKLTKDEYKNILRFQFGTLELEQGHYSKYLPYVFTEEGVSMLSSVLRTKNASLISVNIMRAFVKQRHFIKDNNFILESNINIRNELDSQKKKLLEHDKKFDILFSHFNNKEKKEMIFFDGQMYDAFSKILDILSLAKKELIIIDPYADKKILDMISNVKVNVTLITMKDRNLKQSSIDNYNNQYDNLKVIYDYSFHDRYIIIDKEVIYHSGASLTGAGKKTFSIDKYEEPEIIELLLDKIDKII